MGHSIERAERVYADSLLEVVGNHSGMNSD